MPEKSLRHTSAAHASWARTDDRLARLAPAHEGRDAFIASKYGIPAELEQSNPAEYHRRLESAKKAWYGQLAQKSVKARRKAKELQAEAAAAEAELRELGEAS